MKCHSCGKNIDLFSNDILDMVYYAVRVSNAHICRFESVPICSMECSREFYAKQWTHAENVSKKEENFYR